MDNLLSDLWSRTWFRLLSFLLVFPVYSMAVKGIQVSSNPVINTVALSALPVVMAYVVLVSDEE